MKLYPAQLPQVWEQLKPVLCDIRRRNKLHGIQKTQTHGDDESTDAAIEFLRTENPLLTLVYLEEIDEVGHKYGFGDEYRQAIRRVDGRIGRILHGTLVLTFG